MKYFVILSFLFISCNQKPNCELSAQLNSESECLMIVNKLPDDVFFSSEGINPFTKEKCKCSEGDRWWIQYKTKSISVIQSSKEKVN